MFSILKYQARDHTPVHIFASAVVNRENIPDAQSRLHATDGLHVEAHGGVSGEAVMSRIPVIQLRLPVNSNTGMNCSTWGNGNCSWGMV